MPLFTPLPRFVWVTCAAAGAPPTPALPGPGQLPSWPCQHVPWSCLPAAVGIRVRNVHVLKRSVIVRECRQGGIGVCVSVGVGREG